jgi:hypothetical protein
MEGGGTRHMEREPAGETDKQEDILEQKSTKRSYRLFVRVDIAYRDWTRVTRARSQNDARATSISADGSWF